MKYITYVDHVVERTALCNSDERGLVVCGRVDGRKTVGASRETASHISGEDTVGRDAVETLEEHELGRVRDSGLRDAAELLDDDVRVALDEPGRVHDLRRHVERRRGVREVARLEVVDRHLDREVCVRGDGATVRREHELGRRHLGLSGDETHWRLVA